MTNTEWELLTEKEVQKEYGFSTRMLQHNRGIGAGMPYVKLNRRVRYKRGDVEKYIKKTTTEISTKPYTSKLDEKEKQFLINYLRFKISQTKNKLKPDYYSGRDDNDVFVKESRDQWKKDLKISRSILKKLVNIEEITLSNVNDISDIIALKVLKKMEINNG